MLLRQVATIATVCSGTFGSYIGVAETAVFTVRQDVGSRSTAMVEEMIFKNGFNGF